LAASGGALPAITARRGGPMDLIWIIVIVLVVLALLGYFGFGRRRGL
jgi:flagellar basal body-associated protein FliL